MNAREAGATEIHFGVEWQAVGARGVYRQLVADNGSGMTPDDLQQYFNVFGGGGKPIGGAHENFGIGSKTSLLPWNSYGLVVISYTPGYPEGSMVWLKLDQETNEYGLREFQTEEGALATVVAPFQDDDHGIDWADVKPDFITDHGTVLVLMGSGVADDTVMGDPNHPSESDLRATAKYLNRRFWDLADVQAYSHEFRSTDRDKWPRSESEAYSSHDGAGVDRRMNVREIHGAKHYIRGMSPSLRRKGRPSAEGSVVMQDGASVDWFLWDGVRPDIHDYAPKSGFVGALYRGELYDVTDHVGRFRQFGISEREVRNRLWLVVTPPEYDPGLKSGVYPRGDRSLLAMAGSVGNVLPWDAWGLEFLENIPMEIRTALREAGSGEGGSIEDPTWRKRLQDRFGNLWKIRRMKAAASGGQSITPVDAGTAETRRIRRPNPRRVPHPGGGAGGSRGAQTIGTGDGEVPAREAQVAGGIPYAEWRCASEFDNSWAIATWNSRVPEHPEGVIYLNLDHAVVQTAIEHWVAQYPEAVGDKVTEAVKDVFLELAVARVAHSQQMSGVLTQAKIEEELRSDGALTFGLLGMVDVWALLSDRLPSKVGRKASAA